jgi:hypothetical protein
MLARYPTSRTNVSARPYQTGAAPSSVTADQLARLVANYRVCAIVNGAPFAARGILARSSNIEKVQ